jgi:rubrerythrin
MAFGLPEKEKCSYTEFLEKSFENGILFKCPKCGCRHTEKSWKGHCRSCRATHPQLDDDFCVHCG